MQQANLDTTYCVNEKCNKKCFRHQCHYEFKENENYWFQDYCMDYLEREHKGRCE